MKLYAKRNKEYKKKSPRRETLPRYEILEALILLYVKEKRVLIKEESMQYCSDIIFHSFRWG
jgi:hypothetical protein